MRVATIDIGTNSVLLLVAETNSHGLVAIEEQARVTRLGQDVDRTGVIHEDAFARTTSCLRGYASTIQSLNVSRVAVVGTSALRDATGGERFAAFVEDCLGTPLRVISGHEEARLSFLGATSGLDSVDGQSRVAFDIGGGSTEVAKGQREANGGVRLDYASSFDVGSVRLTERFIKADPPSSDDMARAMAFTRETLSGLPPSARESSPIGIAGTVTTLAAVSLGMTSYDGRLVHGKRLALANIEEIASKLAGLPIAERKLVPGVHPGRADVIVAGAIIVLAVLRQLEANEVQVSDRGLRWGLALELATA